MQRRISVNLCGKMSSVCIVCLTGKVNMHHDINTELMQLYEKLANTKVNTEDTNPKTMCYSCYEQLERCQNFSTMAQRSATILCDLIQKGIEVTHEKIVALNLGKESYKPFIGGNTMVSIKQENTETVSVEFGFKDVRDDTNNQRETVKGEYESDSDREEDMQGSEDNSNGDNSYQAKHPRNHKKIHACNECAKTYPDKKQLQEHLKSHAGKKPFVCRICSKIFPYQDNLSKHFKTHPGEKPYACELCDKTFQRIIDLKQHIVLLHNEKAPVHSTKARLKRK